MKSLLSLLWLLLLSCTFVHGVYFDINTCTELGGIKQCVFVSPDGFDGNNGTSISPFRTITRALSFITSNVTGASTMVLADGSYPGGIVWQGSDITLTSINGASSTFIDCNKIPNIRGLWIGSGETSTTIISGVTIRNCRTTMGAALAIVGETTKPMIKDVQLMNNSATMGGGALIFFASPTFLNVNVSFNSARDGSGMMMTHNASMIIAAQLQAMSLALNYVSSVQPIGTTAFVSMTNMQFTWNIATGLGGGYYLMAAYKVTCFKCVFANNIAAGSGAIAVGTRSLFSVTNSMFLSNQAQLAMGGAVSVQQGSVGTITGCTFMNNIAAVSGGGMAVGTTGAATITNSIFDGNQATQGSIVFNDATGRALITGCTTRNNIATQQGGILLLNPIAASKYNSTSNTYNNNQALGGYAADFGSTPVALAFIPQTSTNLGSTQTTPSILPTNISSMVTREAFNLDTISLRLILIDNFGQRVDLNSSNQTDLYADIMTLDNVTIPALLVESTRVRMPGGLADVEVVIVGEIKKTYAVQWSVDTPGVAPIRLLVTIKSCAQYDVTTYYDGTNFPICHTATPHVVSDSLFQGIIVISCILIAMVLITQGLTIWYWSTPVFKGSTPIFMSLMLAGAILGYLSTILSVMDVNRTNQYDSICKSQYWMMGVAFILMFATLALKTWRIRNIFCNETLTEIKSVSNFGLLRWLALFLSIEMAIHIIWISVDPLKSTLTLSQSNLAYTCASQHDNIFLIVNLVYKGLIAAVCVLFAYQTRDVVSKFNESRQLMIASYNMFVSVIVVAALSLALPSVDARRTVYSAGALFVITSTWFVLFAPKLYIAIFKSEMNISTGTGSGGKHSHSQDHKYSFGNKPTSYHNQQSKSSFNNKHETGHNAGSATPSRSKAGSAANTAPGSPAIQHTKLSLNLAGRSSMSAMTPSPVAGSPNLAAIHIPRGLSIVTRAEGVQPPASSQDDIVLSIPALDLTCINDARRDSQPTLQPNQPVPLTATSEEQGSAHNTPAKNFI